MSNFTAKQRNYFPNIYVLICEHICNDIIIITTFMYFELISSQTTMNSFYILKQKTIFQNIKSTRNTLTSGNSGSMSFSINKS